MLFDKCDIFHRSSLLFVSFQSNVGNQTDDCVLKSSCVLLMLNTEIVPGGDDQSRNI